MRFRRTLPISALAAVTLCFAVATFAQDSTQTTVTKAPPIEMSYLEAAVLGIVEGLTEFLPVSSTGHLILVQRLFGIGIGEDQEAADAYAICIQAGAILAVLGIYFSFVFRMVRGLFGRDREGLRLLTNLFIGFLPAAVVGLSLHVQIKELLFGMRPVTFAWFVGGVAILAVTRWRKDRADIPGSDMMDMRWYGALLIGLIQCLAVWPGTSRSLVTIVGGVLVGLDLRSAVIYSFLLGALTLGASTAYDVLNHGPLLLDTYGFSSMAVGFITAFISAVVAVKWMVNYLKQHGLALFGYYRIVLAVIVGILIATGFLPAD